ncbi:MAG: hypothetical protein FJX77_10880 [Armatimonadetes bacterium]|nr:hypothetical protein [Armatimonadota bacterium]
MAPTKLWLTGASCANIHTVDPTARIPMTILYPDRGAAAAVLDALERVHGCKFYKPPSMANWYFGPTRSAALAFWRRSLFYGTPPRPDPTQVGTVLLVGLAARLRLEQWRQLERGTVLSVHELSRDQQELVRRMLALQAQGPRTPCSPSPTALQEPILLRFNSPGDSEVPVHRRLALRWATPAGPPTEQRSEIWEEERHWAHLSLEMEPVDDGSWRPTVPGYALYPPRDKRYGRPAPKPEPLVVVFVSS